MALNPLKKSLALANDLNDGTLKAAAIIPVNSDGTFDRSAYLSSRGGQAVGVFLLNPSAITDSKSTNWAQQTIPGQSDPILQWTSGGPRTLAFQALVTLDTSNYVLDKNLSPGKNANPLDGIKTIVGQIAAKFSKSANIPAKQTTFTDQLDISAYLNYYRSLLYPTYTKDVANPRIQSSPPIVALVMGPGIQRLPYGEVVTSNNDLWVVTNVEIQITKFLPNLAPLEATVNFQLTQYNVRSFSRDRFL